MAFIHKKIVSVVFVVLICCMGTTESFHVSHELMQCIPSGVSWAHEHPLATFGMATLVAAAGVLVWYKRNKISLFQSFYLQKSPMSIDEKQQAKDVFAGVKMPLKKTTERLYGYAAEETAYIQEVAFKDDQYLLAVLANNGTEEAESVCNSFLETFKQSFGLNTTSTTKQASPHDSFDFRTSLGRFINSAHAEVTSGGMMNGLFVASSPNCSVTTLYVLSSTMPPAVYYGTCEGKAINKKVVATLQQYEQKQKQMSAVRVQNTVQSIKAGKGDIIVVASTPFFELVEEAEVFDCLTHSFKKGRIIDETTVQSAADDLLDRFKKKRRTCDQVQANDYESISLCVVCL